MRLYAAIDRAMSGITTFFSTFVIQVVFAQYSNKLTLTLVMLEVMLLWNALDPFLRQLQRRLDGATAARWTHVVFSKLDFIAMLGLYLLIQLTLGLVQTAWKRGVPDFVETAFGIVACSLFGFAVLQKIKELEDDEQASQRYLEGAPMTRALVRGDFGSPSAAATDADAADEEDDDEEKKRK
jgi:hypothetical protein